MGQLYRIDYYKKKLTLKAFLCLNLLTFRDIILLYGEIYLLYKEVAVKVAEDPERSGSFLNDVEVENRNRFTQ